MDQKVGGLIIGCSSLPAEVSQSKILNPKELSAVSIGV